MPDLGSLIWSSDTARIYHGDGPAGLAALDEPVQLVLTDPPYACLMNANIKKPKNRKTGHEGQLRRDAEWDHLSPGQYSHLMRSLLRAAGRHSGHWTTWVHVFCRAEEVGTLERLSVQTGCKYRMNFTWAKTNPPPRIRVPLFRKCDEHAAILSVGSPPFYETNAHNVFVEPFEHPTRRLHEVQKPVALLCRLLECYTQPGDLVADPFAGGFSTLVACLRTGRRFIGWEIDPRRCELAALLLTEGFGRARQAAAEYGFVTQPEPSTHPTLFDADSPSTPEGWERGPGGEGGVAVAPNSTLPPYVPSAQALASQEKPHGDLP